MNNVEEVVLVFIVTFLLSVSLGYYKGSNDVRKDVIAQQISCIK